MPKIFPSSVNLFQYIVDPASITNTCPKDDLSKFFWNEDGCFSNNDVDGIETTLEEEEFSNDDRYSPKGYKHEDRLSLFIEQYTKYCTENIYTIFPKEYDAQIADAILELFRKREHIDIFNKKALYIFIREQIDVKTPKITKIANVLYAIFKKKYMFYLEHNRFPYK